jgi:hypothetical protein
MTIATDMLQPQKEIYNFLRSATIKYEPIGRQLNSALEQTGNVVSNDKTTWKYYINMTGAYHSTDTMMQVVSLDTRQVIDFTVATLAVNPRTRAAYMPGGDYYSRLCQLYPAQISLIGSILFPVSSIENAIAAEDFTLLAYGDGYLEPDEQPLIIMEIEKFLRIYHDRWYFSFLDDEPLFYIKTWGTLWSKLAACIMAARISFIQTPYVHSFFLWNKLQANGLSNYSDILDRRKSMMLYQNIDYLRANAGKQSNLIILANGLLSDFGIGLYGRQVIQESETNAASYELTPQLAAVRIPTNFGVLATEIVTEDVATVQTQIYTAGLTAADGAETVATVERRLGDTTLNQFMTKFLEIRPIA